MSCGEVSVLNGIYKLFGGIFSPLLHNRINFQATEGGHTPEVSRLYVYFHKNGRRIPKSTYFTYALNPTTTNRLRIKRTRKMSVCLWVKFQRSNLSVSSCWVGRQNGCDMRDVSRVYRQDGDGCSRLNFYVTRCNHRVIHHLYLHSRSE